MTSALPIAVVRTDRGLRSRAVLVGRTCRFVDSDDVPVGLAHAWERLKHVRDPAPTVLQDLVLVLRETVEARPRQAPLVKLPSPPVRGGRRDRPVDLTAAIADPRNTVHLLEALWSQGPAPHPSRFELPPDAPDATGPLPRGLRTDLLPLLRQATWPEVERMRGLAALLDLEAQEGRRAAVAALLVTLEVRETLAWLEALTSVPRAWVTPLLERMARSGRPPGSPELLADLALLAEEASGLWQLLENSRGLPDLDWLEAGVGWVYRGGAGEPDATFDAAVWREASRVLASAPWTLQAVWQEIPRRPGLLAVVGPALQLSPHTLKAWLDVLLVDVDLASWRRFVPRAPALLAEIGGLTSDRVDRFLQLVRGALPELPADHLALAARLAAPPFPEAVTDWWLEDFGPEGRAALAAHDDAVLARVERSRKRGNDAVRIGGGIETLVQVAPDLAVRALAEDPVAVHRLARALGDFPEEERARLLRAGLAQPVHALGTLATEPLVRAILEIGPRTSPVSRALREHVEGVRPLRPGQLARAEALLRDGLLTFRLGELHRFVEAQHATGFTSEALGPTTLHALQMLRHLRPCHRRSLRRLIHQELAGDRTPHPRNVEWARRHPELDLELWTSDFQDPGAPGVRSVLDPLERLLAGTRVGSCLGIGGAHIENAAALALDVNKRVVYARSPEGHLQARLILGFSEEGTVLLHAPYPESVGQDVRDRLLTWVEAFTDALGVPLHDWEDDGYTLPCIVGPESWRDDGLWRYDED